MNVRVRETWHESPPITFDHRRAGRGTQFRGDGLDQVSFDQDVGVLGSGFASAVEDVYVAKQDA